MTRRRRRCERLAVAQLSTYVVNVASGDTMPATSGPHDGLLSAYTFTSAASSLFQTYERLNLEQLVPIGENHHHSMSLPPT